MPVPNGVLRPEFGAEWTTAPIMDGNRGLWGQLVLATSLLLDVCLSMSGCVISSNFRPLFAWLFAALGLVALMEALKTSDPSSEPGLVGFNGWVFAMIFCLTSGTALAVVITNIFAMKAVSFFLFIIGGLVIIVGFMVSLVMLESHAKDDRSSNQPAIVSPTQDIVSSTQAIVSPIPVIVSRPWYRRTTTLYHMTSITNAVGILRAQAMYPGADGLCGSGIYFAPADSKLPDKALRHGVILAAEVDLGKVMIVDRSDIRGDEDWVQGVTQQGFDSVRCTGLRSGDEYVVYDSSRVHSISFETADIHLFTGRLRDSPDGTSATGMSVYKYPVRIESISQHRSAPYPVQIIDIHDRSKHLGWCSPFSLTHA
jgi:hypothetical protein